MTSRQPTAAPSMRLGSTRRTTRPPGQAERRPWAPLLATVFGVVLVAAGCAAPSATSAPAATNAPAATSAAASDDDAARQYCTDQGGMLVDRIATWNTNADPSAWLQLAGRMTFCEFESVVEGDQTSSRISVDLVTLYSEEPTLAAVAYLSKVPPVLPPEPSANPAQYNCTEGLGGAAAFGNTATVGGWVDQSQPVFVVMNMCMFADASAIDEFGIFYYAASTIRGADLAPILRYQPGDQLPAMFDRQRR